MFLCEEQEEGRWKDVDTFTASIRYWQQDIASHSLDTYQNLQCLIESQIPRHKWPKTYLGCPIIYRTPNSSSKNAKLKQTLMKMCTTFSTTTFFHRFLMSGRTGSTRYQNRLSNRINSDRTS